MYKRKNQITVCVLPSEDSFYREQRKVVTEIDDNGNEKIRSYLEKVPVEEISAEIKRIGPDDYTLKKLLKAGIPLEQVNLNGVFGSSDPLDLDAKNAPIVEKAFDDLLQHDAHLEYQRIADNLKNNVTENSGNYQKTE